MAAEWHLIVRSGSKVERERVPTLEEGLDALAARLAPLREAPPLRTVRGLGREYEPVKQVAARLELARGRLGRPRGGIDVRGDGSVEAWLGLVRKRLLDGPDPVVALGEALAAS